MPAPEAFDRLCPYRLSRHQPAARGWERRNEGWLRWYRHRRATIRPTDGEHRGVVDRRHDRPCRGYRECPPEPARPNRSARAGADAADHRHGLGRVVDRHGAESEVDRRSCPRRPRTVTVSLFSGRQLQGDRTDQRPLRTRFAVPGGERAPCRRLFIEGSALDDAPRRSELGAEAAPGCVAARRRQA